MLVEALKGGKKWDRDGEGAIAGMHNMQLQYFIN